MKLNHIIRPLVIVSLMVSSVSFAATVPSKITQFTSKMPKGTLSVKPTSWRDPAFGNKGWTHNSDWGILTATAGKTVTINLASSIAGLHPGITVWYRGQDDTADDSYIPDHFYQQAASLMERGAQAENTKAPIGNIAMHLVAFDYDQDGNLLKPWKNKGQKDGISGKMSLKFKAAKTGTYIFVVGGFNPAAKVDKTIKRNIAVTVQSK